MSRLTIKNYAAPQWTEVLETRSSMGLGSILAESRRVTIELHQPLQGSEAFTCTLSFTLSNGDKERLTNTQPKAHAAIDGVLARARRTLARRGLLSTPSEPSRVSQSGAGYAPFR